VLVAAVVLVTVLGTVGPTVGASLTDEATDCQGRTTVPDELDIGSASVGNTTQASYTFKNPSDQRISFEAEIRGADADAFSLASGAGGSVGPGQCVELTITFTPDSAGDFDASLAVEAEGETGGTALDGQGIEPAFPEATFGPESQDFGSVQVGSTAETEFVLANTGEAPLAVEGASLAGSDQFSLVGELPDEVGPGQQASVTVAFSPSETSAVQATVSVDTNDSETGGLSATVTGEGIETDLSLSSASMTFGETSVGDAKELSVTLTNDGTETVQVSGLSLAGSDDAFTVVESPGGIDPGESAELVVVFEPGETRSYGGTITVETESEEAPDLGISLSGSGTAPKLQAAPQSVNFGKTVTGEILTRDVRLINRGNEPLSIESLSIVGANQGAFSIQGGAPGLLAPGEGATVTVRFAPSQATPHSATLVVDSNATSGSSSIYLSNTRTTVKQETRTTDNGTTSDIEVEDADEGQKLTFAFGGSGSGNPVTFAGAASDYRTHGSNVSLATMNITLERGGDFRLGVSSSEQEFGATPRFGLQPRNGTEPVGYLNVTHTVPDENISEVEFTHRVSKERLRQLDADVEDYALYRYVDGEWVELNTTVVGEADSFYVVKATSPGLSDFTSGVKQPKFRVVDAEVEVTKINIGEDVGVRVEIRNDGGSDGTYTTRLIFDDEVVAQKDATIGPEDSRVVTFQQEISESGTYTVQVNNQTINDITVEQEELSTAATSTDATATDGGQTGAPGFGVVVALVALAGAALLSRRRR
jgi:PGF-CTERM protein